MIEIGTLLQERYLIEKQIGAGGMGAVYLAVDKRFDNHVAIKETFYNDEELSEAFEREARLLNALQHPVLPHVTDYFSENNGYFLVMQFIDGEDLSDILKRDGAFAAADVIRWTNQLLDALDYLHSQEHPIIHRDIKPHNLKLTPRGDIMLLDFGLAKLNSDETTRAISVFGYSRTYSPLEQIQGTGTDARSDIFALGATVYHLLTGKPPVDALTRAAAIVNGKTDPILLASEINPEISGALASVLNSALALNPENRFISAVAMRQALEYAIGEISAGNFFENAAQPVESIPQVVPIEPAENEAAEEAFPALESFAADEAEKESTGAGEMPQIIEIEPPAPVSQRENSSRPALNEAVYPAAAAENSFRPAETTRPKQKKGLWAAAAAAVLIFGVIAFALYFAGRDETPVENSEAPVAETDTAANTNRKKQEKTEPDTETVAETKTKNDAVKPAQKNQGGEHESDTAVTETAETEQTAPVEPVRNQTTTRRPTTNSTEAKNSENADPDTTTDAAQVESVFTGRENERTAERNERRRLDREIPEEMSEEEFEQIRRERRERRRERRERRNNQPIPF